MAQNPRSIFEEVASSEKVAPVAKGSIDRRGQGALSARIVRAAGDFVVIGGKNRLSRWCGRSQAR